MEPVRPSYARPQGVGQASRELENVAPQLARSGFGHVADGSKAHMEECKLPQVAPAPGAQV